ARYAALADAFGDRAALGLELARLDPAVDRGAHRVRRGDDDARVLVLQVLADAGERAARADGAREAVDRAVRLRPDLGTRALDVAAAVRRVVPLIGVQHAVRLGRRELLGRAFRGMDVVVRIAERHGRYLADLGAAQPERVLFLLRLRVRHQNQGAIAARVADERQADPGVTGRALDDEPAALDDAALL